MQELRARFPGGSVLLLPLRAPGGLCAPTVKVQEPLAAVAARVVPLVAAGADVESVARHAKTSPERVFAAVSAVGTVLGRSARRRGVRMVSMSSARPGASASASQTPEGWVVVVVRGWSTSHRDLRRSVAQVMVASEEEAAAAVKSLAAGPGRFGGRSWCFDLWCADRFGWWELSQVSTDPQVVAGWWGAWLQVSEVILEARRLLVAAAQVPVGGVGAVASALSAPRLAWSVPHPELMALVARSPGSAVLAQRWQGRVRESLLEAPQVWVPWRLGQLDERRWDVLVEALRGRVLQEELPVHVQC